MDGMAMAFFPLILFSILLVHGFIVMGGLILGVAYARLMKKYIRSVPLLTLYLPVFLLSLGIVMLLQVYKGTLPELSVVLTGPLIDGKPTPSFPAVLAGLFGVIGAYLNRKNRIL